MAANYIPEDSSKEALIKSLKQTNLESRIVQEIISLINENTSLKKHIEEENTRYTEFLNNMPLGFFRIDANENYILVNDAYTEICGYTREEMLEPEFKVSKTWAIAEGKKPTTHGGTEKRTERNHHQLSPKRRHNRRPRTNHQSKI
jgi:PAS domain S-box-containing protein